MNTEMPFKSGMPLNTGMPLNARMPLNTGMPLNNGMPWNTGMSLSAGIMLNTGIPLNVGTSFTTGMPLNTIWKQSWYHSAITCASDVYFLETLRILCHSYQSSLVTARCEPKLILCRIYAS